MDILMMDPIQIISMSQGSNMLLLFNKVFSSYLIFELIE